jgi:hypothetical protein
MTGKRRRWSRIGAVLALAPLLGAAAAPPRPPPPIIQIGSAYFAKQLCSCLFVAGRSEQSCRAEFKPRIDSFAIDIDRGGLPKTARVTARLGSVAAVAAYARRFGCVLVQ